MEVLEIPSKDTSTMRDYYAMLILFCTVFFFFKGAHVDTLADNRLQVALYLSSLGKQRLLQGLEYS